MQFRLFQDNSLAWKLYYLLLVSYIWHLNLFYNNSLIRYLYNLFSLYSVNIDLHYWLLVEYWFILDYLHWALDLYGNLYSLLNWDYLSYLNNSVDKSVNVHLHRSLLNNLHYDLFSNCCILLG
jgi:hypothetical protein